MSFPIETRLIRLWGIVQGVGMRPLAARLARSLQIRGSVRNIGGLLEITITGPADRLDRFWLRLFDEKPEPAAFVRFQVETIRQSINESPVTTDDPADHGFTIEPSCVASGLAFPAPDLAVCSLCEAELADPANRRFRHAFISCMHCGPRYSILERLPYDRETTTMSGFSLCPKCHMEYRTDSDRRFHAQTIACPDCGPVLEWIGLDKNGLGPDSRSMDRLTTSPASVQRAIEAINSGRVIAVKATGGYHLVCDAQNQTAVDACRAIKQRDRKPFAVLFADLHALSKLADLSPEEAELISSQTRPVVLLRQRNDAKAQGFLAHAVSLQSPFLGAMLPSTPIQLLLAQACGSLVMTSANRSDEQLIFRDQDMVEFASEQPLLAGILKHDRPILTGLDDAVARLFAHPDQVDVPFGQSVPVSAPSSRTGRTGRTQLLRRSRGHVPLAIDLGMLREDTGSPDITILALGADMKATSAWSKSGFAWLTQPAGDLARLDVQKAWQEQLVHLQKLLQLQPSLICHDLHPAYFSTEVARSWNTTLLAVQHHHAHIASVMAEHHLTGPVLGIALDGTGYGPDGTVWGGEFLSCDGATYERLAHFKSVLLPGGDSGMREAWRSLAGYLEDARLPDPEFLTDEAETTHRMMMVRASLRTGINCIPNSSVGRLFDAVCALLRLSDVNHYEGECGSLLEYQAIEAQEHGLIPWPLAFAVCQTGSGGCLTIDPAPVFHSIVEAMSSRTDHLDDLIPRLALGFHQAVSTAVVSVCNVCARQKKVSAVALSGGVFQNSVLVELVDTALTKAGFRVYWNEKVPPHDGGICLGQAWIGQLERD